MHLKRLSTKVGEGGLLVDKVDKVPMDVVPVDKGRREVIPQVRHGKAEYTIYTETGIVEKVFIHRIPSEPRSPLNI